VWRKGPPKCLVEFHKSGSPSIMWQSMVTTDDRPSRPRRLGDEKKIENTGVKHNGTKPSHRSIFISSFHELMQSRGVRRPSVCRLSVCKLCANRFFYQTNGWIATKLAHHGPQTGLHPGCAQGQR